MAGSRGTEAAEQAVLTRRDAIIGALAMAAGTLIASKPEEAHAISGDPINMGAFVIGSTETKLWRTSTGLNNNQPFSQVMIAGSDDGSNPYRALEGAVSTYAPTDAVGVRGWALGAGQTGVVAQNDAYGVGLKVIGRATFSRSGKATIAKKHSTLTVTVPSGILTSALILVTLQGSGGSGVYLKYAKRMTATTFKVALNKKAKSAVEFAWMIVG